MRAPLLLASPLAALVKAYPEGDAGNPAWATCKALIDLFPSNTYWPETDMTSKPYRLDTGNPEYDEDMRHRVMSSSQFALCSIRPRTAHELSQIVKIIGKLRPPFAVKSGGCASEKGWSLTNGVMISMKYFNSIYFKKEVGNLDSITTGTPVGTVTFGAGQAWSDLYQYLDDKNVMVVGGRIVGVGVGGFILGGGYSWLSNKHGLSIDTVLSYELITPSGDILHVAGDSYPDLFFALKGGFNNFGIVTELTMTAFKQGDVYGGSFTYALEHVPAGLNAIADFQAANKDMDGNLFASYAVDFAGKQKLTVVVWYNAPHAPVGFWDGFIKTPHVNMTLGSYSFLNFIKATSDVFGTNKSSTARFASSSISLPDLDRPALGDIVNVLTKYAAVAGEGYTAKATIEPFLFPVANYSKGETAFAHNLYTSPLAITMGGSRPGAEIRSRRVLVNASDELRSLIRARHPTSWQLPLYSNYALGNVQMSELYGDNTYRLRDIQKKYDPTMIMGLAGGYKISYT